MSLGVFACGGDDSISTADARRIDAGIDGAGTMGVGQLCSDVTDPCPSDAMTCLSFTATAPFGYCTPICRMGHMATTNAQGMFPSGSLTLPPEATQMCVSAFHATVGTPRCGLSVGITPDIPAGGSPAPNTQYTIDYACAILCATPGNTCPEGLVCNTTLIPNAALCIPAE